MIFIQASCWAQVVQGRTGAWWWKSPLLGMPSNSEAVSWWSHENKRSGADALARWLFDNYMIQLGWATAKIGRGIQVFMIGGFALEIVLNP